MQSVISQRGWAQLERHRFGLPSRWNIAFEAVTLPFERRAIEGCARCPSPWNVSRAKIYLHWSIPADDRVVSSVLTFLIGPFLIRRKDRFRHMEIARTFRSGGDEVAAAGFVKTNASCLRVIRRQGFNQAIHDACGSI